ncbi:MAG: PAS domain-containing protein, partial [Candidatus Sumerlaeota bacterium]
MQTTAFAERFLEHLNKIEPAEIESFVRRTVKERNFTARIFETLSEGVLVFDFDLKITLVNSAARRMLRMPAERRLVGESVLEFVPDGALREMLQDYV